jgi:hypothetical protein
MGRKEPAVRDFLFAAPSCVIPGTAAENSSFLSGRVDEVGLCFFEAESCLTYTKADLPPNLADLPLSWHVHLPLDLPCPDFSAATEAAEVALILMERIAFLGPKCAVLHPPQGTPAFKRSFLDNFARIWQKNCDIPLLLENIGTCDIVELGENFLSDHGFGLCLDVGHLLGYKQIRLLSSELPETADLIHWSAPGGQDEHLPLTALTSGQYAEAVALAARCADARVWLVEVFHWPGVEASLPVLKRLGNRGIGHDQH